MARLRLSATGYNSYIEESVGCILLCTCERVCFFYHKTYQPAGKAYANLDRRFSLNILGRNK